MDTSHSIKDHALTSRVTESSPPPLKVLNSPWRITLDTNPDDCNLHCIMCEEFSPYSTVKQLRIKKGGPKRRRMTLPLIEKVLKEAHEMGGVKEIIPSTMGEPLLYKHFDRILDLCAQYGFKLNLTTNGTFPRKTAKEWAELIVPIGSDVKISWNGATKETAESIMQGISFEKNLQNLKDFISVRDQIAKNGGNRCSITLQLTFMENNLGEFVNLLKMAIRLGVDRIKGHHLWVHFPQMKNQSLRRSSETIKKWNRVVEEMYTIANSTPLPNGSLIKLDNIYPLDPAHSNEELNPTWICPFLGREAWVAWDGRFNPCCAPDAKRKKLGHFGNLNEISLSEIWTGDNYRSLVKTYHQNPLCKSCNMRRPAEDVWK